MANKEREDVFRANADRLGDGDINPLHAEVDHRFAGDLLDPWLGYIPEDSVIKAIKVAAERPGDRIIAFVVPREPRSDFRRDIDHQKRAGQLYVEEHLPHLKVSFRTITAPFRGVGSDVRVFYVTVGPEVKQDD